MIKFINGDIFKSKDEALVNPVNCVGVSGKGLALKFKEKFPENYIKYKNSCLINNIRIGKLLLNKENNKTIINFPTKIHWMNDSKIEYVEKGLDDLKKIINKYNIKSISIPALGVGCGRLKWDDVKGVIINKLENMDDVIIHVYNPL